MEEQILKVNTGTIAWRNNDIVDWISAGTLFSLSGITSQLGRYHYSVFDRSIVSRDGQYAFIYKKLGTKGLLLKNGELLREINRSYYCAEVYEYPAVFVTLDNGTTYLVHCPLKYCQLDFEEVETGKIVTASADREPFDCFHSRLEVSPGSTYLLSKGWYWHPWDDVLAFDIAACLADPLLLDKRNLNPGGQCEVNTASFINDMEVLIGASLEAEDNAEEDDEEVSLKPGHIAIWNLHTGEMSKPIKVNAKIGNLIAIDSNHAWDLVGFPKLINIVTGEIEDKMETILTGEQMSPIIHHLKYHPEICYNRELKKLAMRTDSNTITILTK